MSVLLFRLNNVPEEEAQAVRELLQRENFDFYETSAGTFGISVAAIWLRDREQLPAARRLLDDFQAEHSEQMRREWQESRDRGEAENFLARLQRQPLKSAIYILAVLAILYLSIVPWFDAWS